MLTKTIIFCFLSIFLFAQPRPPSEFIVDSWGQEQGLPQNSVNSICQTRDGYLWLATFGGLVRFDGVRFTVFDRFNSPGMKADRCLVLHEDSRGQLWVGTENGLVLYTNGVFRTFGPEENLSNTLVTMVTEDKRGIIWVMSRGNPMYLRNGKFYEAKVSEFSPEYESLLENDELTFFSMRKNIAAIRGDSIILVFNAFDRFGSTVRDMKKDNHNTVWIALNGGGLLRKDGNGYTRIRKKNGLISDNVFQLFPDENGDLWIGTEHGVSVLSNGKIVNIGEAEGFKNEAISSIEKDREGNFWIGTSTSGLVRVRRTQVKMYGVEQGLSNEKIISLCERSDGSILVGTNCGGLNEIRNGVAGVSTLNRFPFDYCHWSLFEDSQGRLWGNGTSLTMIQNDRAIQFDSITSTIFALYEDSKRQIWTGKSGGLFVLPDKKPLAWKRIAGMEKCDVRAIREDKDGTIWIGTVNGLYTVKNDSLFPVADISGLQSNYVRAIHQDNEGTLWFGTYGGGIIRLQNGKFSVITTNDGLFDNIVSHIVEDEFGFFWMGCNRGIFRVARSSLNGVADGTVSKVLCKVFGKTEGMTSLETNGGFQPNAVLANDGKIYFPTIAGVAVIDPREIRSNELQPNVVIEKLNVEGVSTSLDSHSTIDYEHANLEFQYTALSFVDPPKVRFQYKLEGYDEHWIDAGGRRSAFYTKVSPGKHTFRVIASNNDGKWNEMGASISLTILPPYWMTWWFRTLAVLLFLSVGPSIYFFRISTLKKEKQVQREFAEKLINSQEQERRRIASELHDGLGQSILVIKNRAAMALLSAENTEEMKIQMNEISESASSVIKDVRNIAHNLRPVHLERFGLSDTLNAAIEQIASSSSINWKWKIENIDGAVSKENEINVFRIVQEGINNILKHSDAAAANVEINNDGMYVQITMTDNGKGFDHSSAVKKSGLGLVGMEERAKFIGGSYVIESQPGKGPILRIIIPVNT